MFVVFDLDGTIANTDHRAHLVDRAQGKPDWRAFYAACAHDTPHWHTVSVFRALRDAGHRVEIWSGRSKEVWQETQDWLRAYELQNTAIRMREDGDYTPDDVLKRSWLADGKPDLIFDDRAKVVAMWREEGIPCFQVAPGDF
jgi:phosphoserine phosphatase